MADVLNRAYKTAHSKKYNILYVDDEEVNLRIFERAFNKFYQVYTAPSGQDALEILKKHRMDLIMTDQRMPNMTGVELLLRVVPKYPNMVRMIMTGFSDEEAIMEVDDKVGLDRYLVKPWNKDELKEEFDRALEMRFENGVSNPKQIVGSETEKDFIEEEDEEDSNHLDLVKSTLSLVEQHENQELRAEINSLVEASKAKKRPEFVQTDTNDLLMLKESLMPLQQEIKLYLGDSVIVYDHRSVNRNGYWFGEAEDHLVVASFFSNTGAIQAITLNTFIGSMLTEMVYKDRNLDPDSLIVDLSNRINVRFIGRDKAKKETVDIAVIVINKADDTCISAGANHDVFCYDGSGTFHVVKGANFAMKPGATSSLDTQSLADFDAKEMYLIPKNIIDETGDGAGDLESLKQLLAEIRRYPMSMQGKLFDEYHFKSVIGLRL